MNHFVYPIFVSLAFVSSCCCANFNSVLLHGLLISNVISLECHLCSLNPPCRNKLIGSDFSFLISFILSPSVTKSSTYISPLTCSTNTWNSCSQLSRLPLRLTASKTPSKHQPGKAIDLKLSLLVASS